MRFDFAFVIICYNQEKYVFEHMESIKYQIEHFGCKKKIQVVFSDDCSTDSSIINFKKWINTHHNQLLFSEIDIVTHKTNVGTIRNLYDGINKVKSDNFKMLSCDDLYYKNNIFDIIDADFTITPIINFIDYKICKEILDYKYQAIFACSAPKKKNLIRKLLSYDQVIPTPGVFMKKSLITDDGLYTFLMKYRNIEDIPMFYYIFNKYNKYLEISVLGKPYVLYRLKSGISQLMKKDLDNPIQTEYLKIRKDIKSLFKILPYGINPFYYINKLYEFYIKYIKANNKILRRVNKDYRNEIKGVNEYIERIKNCAQCYV